MSYIKFIFAPFFLIIIGFTQLEAQSRDLDSIYFVKKTPFLNKIIELKDLHANIQLSLPNIVIPTAGTLYTANGQEIIKDEHSLYINIQQTGFIYKWIGTTDSTLKFQRIDQTININYNIGSFNFLYKEQLYSYGGYGFWKTNGHLRGFNYFDKQWDIIPANKEIFAYGYQWLSNKEGRIYVPIQKIINAGLKVTTDQDFRQYDSYYLDLEKKTWIMLGVLDNKARKILSADPFPANFLSLQNGLIHIINDELFYFNFIENKIYRSKKANVNQFFLRRIAMQNAFEYKGKIYFYIPSVARFEVTTFNLSDFEILDFPIWRRDTFADKYVALAIVLVLLVLLFIGVIKQRVKQKIIQSQLKVLKTKSVSQAFVGTEISLIEMLLKSATDNIKVEIHQINHVLGIKDKNVGLQKKVRSDVINGINEKYQIITNGNNPLIASVRKEDDKRFLKYFITPSETKEIQKLLDKK